MIRVLKNYYCIQKKNHDTIYEKYKSTIKYISGVVRVFFNLTSGLEFES